MSQEEYPLKFLKGESINLNKQEKKAGSLYVTTDNGEIWFDTDNDTRICLSSKNAETLAGYRETDLVKYGDALLTTNPFGGKQLYISKIDNALYCANKRWNVAATQYRKNDNSFVYNHNDINLFNGNYDSANLVVHEGNYTKLNLNFKTDTEDYFPGYPYGYFYLTFYYGALPQSVSAKVFSNYIETDGTFTVGWHDLPVSNYYIDDNRQIIAIRNNFYAISELEITITAKDDTATWISQLELHLDRPAPDRTPFLSKYIPETLYYPLTAPEFDGNLTGNANTANQVNHNFIIQLNDGEMENNNLFTFNGEAEKIINITPASIDASPAGHSHDFVSEDTSINEITNVGIMFEATVDEDSEMLILTPGTAPQSQERTVCIGGTIPGNHVFEHAEGIDV